eukprot:m.170450 g.170450  ORF g.170450 m.170450 type:complete len:260 (+) comp17250_c0_seq9:3-782(+)
MIFHAIGKILNPKRQASLPVSDVGLPPHLDMHRRSALIDEDVAEDVVHRARIPTERLNLFLHENALPQLSDLNVAIRVSEYFCVADSLIHWQSPEVNEMYSGNVACRALLHCIDQYSPGSFRVSHRPTYFDVVNKQTSRLAEARRILEESDPRLFGSMPRVMTETFPSLRRCRGLSPSSDLARFASSLSMYSSYGFRRGRLNETDTETLMEVDVAEPETTTTTAMNTTPADGSRPQAFSATAPNSKPAPLLDDIEEMDF